jgi:hypothetical protein
VVPLIIYTVVAKIILRKEWTSWVVYAGPAKKIASLILTTFFKKVEENVELTEKM